MVDKGIEVILNSTVWGEKTHSGAYRNMKGLLGLEASDSSDIGVIINTSMSPWLRAQATYKRLGMIIRNELYTAYGGVSNYYLLSSGFAMNLKTIFLQGL